MNGTFPCVCDSSNTTPYEMQWFSDIGTALVLFLVTVLTSFYALMKRQKLASGARSMVPCFGRSAAQGQQQSAVPEDMHAKIEQIVNTTVNIQGLVARVEEEVRKATTPQHSNRSSDTEIV